MPSSATNGGESMSKHPGRKITILTSVNFPYGNSGSNLVRQMCLGLLYYGNEPSVCLFGGQKSKQDTSATEVPYRNFLPIEKPKSEFLKLIELMLKIIYLPFFVMVEKLRGTNVLLIYGLEYAYQLLPILCMSKLLGVKVLRIQADYYEKHKVSPTWWKLPKWYAYHFQFKYVDRFLDGILCLSNFMKDMSVRNKVKPERILITKHFVDTTAFTEAHSKLNENEYRIGYCGTMNAQNGIFELAKACETLTEQIPHIALHFLGGISDETKYTLLKAVPKMQDKIVFQGKVSHVEIPAILKSCQILVNPREVGSFAESGFSTKLAEYLSTALPVITTKTEDILSNFTSGKELVILQSNHHTELAKAIQDINNNPQQAREIGKRGALWAEENINYLKVSERLSHFLSSL